MKAPNLRVLTPSALPAPPEIKELARTDHRRAMSIVVQKYRGRLYNHALYILKDYEEAYDVVQEVFIKALRERRFFDADFKMKAWLFRVTSNLCFNIIRNRKRRGAILEAMPPKQASDPDQFDRVISEERQETILQSMETLTRNHREILMLRYYSDLSYAEISDTLGIKLGTVMSRLSRAKSKLMEVLDEPGVVDV